MIDGTRTGKKFVSFRGHISGKLSMVLVRAEPHQGYVTESVELSSIVPMPGSKGHGKYGPLSDRLRRKAPRRYFTFSLGSTFAMLLSLDVRKIYSYGPPQIYVNNL